MAYHYREFPFVRPPELDGGTSDAPVAIIGAGPVGLALAIDLAQRGIAAVVLDDDNKVSVGSRAICWAKRTLEIFGRLGVGERMLDKGVTWKVGRLFNGDEQVFAFDLLPEAGHHYPAFVNLQQYYVEDYLLQRCRDFTGLIDLRFLNTVTGHEDHGTHVALDVETPEGNYRLKASYAVACDGAGSPARKRMGLAFEGQAFEEQFLIADIEMDDSPFGSSQTPERWFWFDPVFADGKSVLLHQQPDNIYRIDWQLPQGSDGTAELDAANLDARIRRVIGDDKPFRLDWASVYRFRCLRLERFVHGRVIFAGDSAHVVSPFGARGGNGGVQDIDNLGWKLAAILTGQADEQLLESYDEERGHGADENIRNSSRATNFMTPKTEIEALFRREALRLACDHDFARRLLNSGRLSVPCSLAGSSLTTGAHDCAGLGLEPGTALVDAPLTRDDGSPVWLLDQLPVDDSCLLVIGDVDLPPMVKTMPIVRVSAKGALRDSGGFAEARYGAGTVYLVRPDHHVAARFDHTPSAAMIDAALARALGQSRQCREAAE